MAAFALAHPWAFVICFVIVVGGYFYVLMKAMK
jgi:hypothetical protein